MHLALSLLAGAAICAQTPASPSSEPAAVEPATPAAEPAPAPAAAPEATPAPEPTPSATTTAADAQPIALAALKLGGLFPQVLNRLNTTVVVALEGAWVSPLLGHKLAASLELSYAQPPHARTVTDPRVPSGSYSYTVNERIFGLYLGPKYFFLPPGGKLVPWASLGLRVQFVDSQIVGSAEQAFGQHDETGTHAAFGLQAGAGYRVGPGLLALELMFTSSPIDHLVTGNVDVGDLAFRAAYVLTF